MNSSNLLIGLFIIATGFLVKSFPNLIAGYNTMSKEKKKNVDIVGLSTFLRNGLIAIGVTVIISYYIFKWLGITTTADLVMPIVILVGVTFLVIEAQKFDHNKTKKIKTESLIFRLIIVIHALAFFFVVGLITYGLIPSKATLEDDTIHFSGMYGFEASLAEIDNIELTDSIPTIKARTNGFSLGSVNKGFFHLDKFGKSRLLIHSKTEPYLILTEKNGNKTIINFKDKIETQKMFEKIKSAKAT